MNKVIWGDAQDALKRLDDNSVDLLCTDPPYGYSFMGKDWDKAVPSVEIWKECLRVLKPGAFAFIMSAPRQDVLSQMIVRIGEAGFDTDFTSIYWTYASGFPKAMNIGKAVDKRNGVEREVIAEAKQGAHDAGFKEGSGGPMPANYSVTSGTSPLEGSYGGFQPKPAVEVIIVAMKPLSEKTFVDQALKNGKGVTWLDDCRVPTNRDNERQFDKEAASGKTGSNKAAFAMGDNQPRSDGWLDAGRFPANLLVSDDVLNDGQDRPAAGNTKHVGNEAAIFGNANGTNLRNLYGTVDSYSRYFDLDAWHAKTALSDGSCEASVSPSEDGVNEACPKSITPTFPFLIVPKAAKSEKNAGLTDFADRKSIASDYRIKDQYNSSRADNGPAQIKTTKNHHPTVKPLKLMSYLITLGSRPGDVVLDPFLGSGTTAIAAKQLGRQYIGIEREEEYVDIAYARLRAVPNPLPLENDDARLS